MELLSVKHNGLLTGHMLMVRLYWSTEEQHLLPVLPGLLLRSVRVSFFCCPVTVCCSNIMALRFPGCLGDTQFSFRLRQSVGRRATRRQEEVYNRDAPVTLQVRAESLLPVFRFKWSAYFRHLADFTWLVSLDGGLPFLWLCLLQTGEGCVREERILPEG